MSNKFGTVDTGVWKHREFKQLDDDSKLLFLYLKTCDHQNMIGCFYLPIGYITADLKWSESKVKQTLSKLFKKGFAMVDEDLEMVFLPKHLSKHPLQNPNQAKGAERLFNDIPSKFKYIKDLCESLLSQSTLSEPFRNRLETLCNSITVTTTVSVTTTATDPSSSEPEPKQVWHAEQRAMISDSYNLAIGNTDKPKFSKWSDERIAKLKTRCTEDSSRTLQWWLDLIADIPNHTAAMQGDWFTLDFLLKSEGNLIKFVEGKYRKSFGGNTGGMNNGRTTAQVVEAFVNGDY